MIPVLSVHLPFDDELMGVLSEIEQSGIYSNFGPQVTSMEIEFASFVGVEQDRLVSVANATLGLQGAMSVLDCSTWVIPSWTFAATAHSALLQDAKVYFGDVKLDTWALDPSEVKTAEGAVVTSPFGAQISIAQEWNHVSAMVIDAAAAIGAFPIIDGSFTKPWAIVVSLHATKVLGIGEGAFVVFSSSELATRFRQWTNFGFLGSREAEIAGTNGKLPEISAAVARVRLRRWSEEKRRWRLSRAYVHDLCERLAVNPPFSSTNWISPYWIVNLSSIGKKERLASALANHNIETRNWWSKGCHTMPGFHRIEQRSSLKITDYLASVSLGLPYFNTISDSQLDKIGSILEQMVSLE